MKKLMCLLIAAVLVLGCVYVEDIHNNEYCIYFEFIDGTGYVIEK